MAEPAQDTQFGYDDHFTPARTRKKRKNRPPTEPPSPSVLLDRVSEELAPTDWLCDTLKTLRESLEEVFPSTDAAPDVLCLGLGSPSSSRDARAQLALLLAACDDLRIDRTKVAAFDPVFAAEDLQLLAQRGLTPFPENRIARHALQTPTIAYMPHCDLHLYENLLRENWSRAQLPNVLLIANRLSEYAESIPSRKLAADYPCVARLERDGEWWTLPALSAAPKIPVSMVSPSLVGSPRDPSPPRPPRSPSASSVARTDNVDSEASVNVDAMHGKAHASANAAGDAKVVVASESDATSPSNVRVPVTSDSGDMGTRAPEPASPGTS